MTNNSDQQTPQPALDDWKDQLASTLQTTQALLTTLTLGKRKENNWRTIKWTFIGTMAITSVLMWAIFNAKMIGFQTDPITQSIARVKIEGEIAPSTLASAERVVPLIERACNAKHVTAVLLDINSGGGSPSESERMIAALKSCRQPTDGGKPKKVYALINGIGASAAYMIAMRADEVYAGRYSMVGSIGAIIRYPDMSELANRFGVHEKIYRSAPLKGGPSLISGTTPEDDAAFQELVAKMGRSFLDDVKASRRGKLKIDDKLLFSGRVWTSTEALNFGMIDRIAVLEDLKAGPFKDAKIYDYKQKSSFAEGMGFKAVFKDAISEALQAKVQ